MEQQHPEGVKRGMRESDPACTGRRESVRHIYPAAFGYYIIKRAFCVKNVHKTPAFYFIFFR